MLFLDLIKFPVHFHRETPPTRCSERLGFLIDVWRLTVASRLEDRGHDASLSVLVIIV